MGLSLENRSASVASFTPVWLGESASYMTAYMVTETFQRPSASQSGVGAFWLFFPLRKSLGSPGSCKSATVLPAAFSSPPLLLPHLPMAVALGVSQVDLGLCPAIALQGLGQVSAKEQRPLWGEGG